MSLLGSPRGYLWPFYVLYRKRFSLYIKVFVRYGNDRFFPIKILLFRMLCNNVDVRWCLYFERTLAIFPALWVFLPGMWPFFFFFTRPFHANIGLTNTHVYICAQHDPLYMRYKQTCVYGIKLRRRMRGIKSNFSLALFCSQTCTTWPSFPLFSVYSLLLHCFYTKISSFMPVLSTGIVRGCFYLPIFYSEKFSCWGLLTFAVCGKRESQSLYWQVSIFDPSRQYHHG